MDHSFNKRLNSFISHVNESKNSNDNNHLTIEKVSYDKNTLTVIDNRDGKKYELKITSNTINSKDLKPLKLKTYDPGYAMTCAAKSKITYIDGANGILRYRGYAIEDLAKNSSFLEVSFLLLYGNLPSKTELDYFSNRVMRHTYVHEDLKQMMKSFRYDSHPMGMLVSSVSALGTFHPEANPALNGRNIYDSKTMRNKQIHE